MKVLLAGLITLILLIGCTNNKLENISVNDKLYSLPENCDFYEIKNNTGEEYECSPKLKDPYFSEFRGILINAPKSVVWERGLKSEDYSVTHRGNREGPLRIMLAGLLKIPYGTQGINDDFKYKVLVVAVDQKTSITYEGKMSPFGTRRRVGLPGYYEAKKGLAAKENFNIDLVHNLNIPITEAKYTIYATFGEYKSNVLEVDVKIK